MSILLTYLSKQKDFQPAIPTPPSSNLNLCIIIPCFNEENVYATLKNITLCQTPKSDVEVILVINAPEACSSDILEQNQKSYNEFIQIQKENTNPKLRFHCIIKEDIPQEQAGVGYARKIGMDEAVYRFSQVANNKGIIVSLDADCRVSENYLIEIEQAFKKNIHGCSIRFEHPINGTEFPVKHYEAITYYELYLHYYQLAFKNTGHPFAFYTIGSAFAVRVDIYAKQGGMNKRKAGEDFYFLHKIIPLGKFIQLNTCVVYPSARSSSRVPFGTSATIQKLISEKEINFFTYDPGAFDDLKLFFSKIDNFFYSPNNFKNIINSLHPPLQDFLYNQLIEQHLNEIRKNTSDIKNFKNRFFRWFNAFMVLKYLNFSHQNYYHKQPLIQVACIFLRKNYPYTIPENISPLELLLMYRKLSYNQ